MPPLGDPGDLVTDSPLLVYVVRHDRHCGVHPACPLDDPRIFVVERDPEAGLAGDTDVAEEAGCVVGTVLSDDLGVGTVAEERLSPIFSWVVEYFLVETSMHCF